MQYFLLKAKEAKQFAQPISIQECGCTPLHYAVKYGTVEIISVLIDKRADVNVRNKVPLV